MSASDLNTPADSTEPIIWDPVFLHARREALVIVLIFTACLAWTIGWCWWDGYNVAVDADAMVPMVFGMPRWVFWGIGVPWLVADVVTIWFCVRLYRADDLSDGEEDPLAEASDA